MKTKLERVEKMIAAAQKSIDDWLSAGNENHGTAEQLSRILKETQQKLNEGLISDAAQEYVQGTGKWVEFDVWNKRVGVDLATLNFRLLDLCGKLYNKRLARWDEPDY